MLKGNSFLSDGKELPEPEDGVDGSREGMPVGQVMVNGWFSRTEAPNLKEGDEMKTYLPAPPALRGKKGRGMVTRRRTKSPQVVR